jgi:hypothetical protein
MTLLGTTQVVAYIPTQRFLTGEFNSWSDLREILEELLSGVPFPLPHFVHYGECIGSAFSVFSDDDSDFPPLNADPFLRSRSQPGRIKPFGPHYVIRWDLAARRNGIGTWRDAHDNETEETEEMWASSILSECESSLLDLIRAITLARPVSAVLHGPTIFQDGQITWSGKTMTGDFTFACQYAVDRGWPKIHKLPLSSVLGWLGKHNLARQLGETPVGRAYNAFTYLLSEHTLTDESNLFWVLLGLEALYSRGTENVQRQLDEHSQLLLGQRGTFKRDIKKMYEVRSRFIHGSLPFPPKNFPHDAMPAFNEAMNTIESATDAGLAVLLASLQELIRRDWASLEFETCTVIREPTD